MIQKSVEKICVHVNFLLFLPKKRRKNLCSREFSLCFAKNASKNEFCSKYSLLIRKKMVVAINSFFNSKKNQKNERLFDADRHFWSGPSFLIQTFLFSKPQSTKATKRGRKPRNHPTTIPRSKQCSIAGFYCRRFRSILQLGVVRLAHRQIGGDPGVILIKISGERQRISVSFNNLLYVLFLNFGGDGILK
jgi:hypothetical protein